ncbi:MAG TPA: DegV family protein [Actinomycetales bacterium]|nr:DegV family protein [Actinomycetales bacterium]
MAVAVVTDSTAYLPQETVERLGVRVVPLQVVVGGTPYAEGRDIDSRQVADALRAYTPVSTSRPSPQDLLDSYVAAAEAGADAIVSLHISAAMSGTYEAAVLAARESPVPTEVVDSRSLAMGLGFLVVEAARAAGAGRSASDITDVARRRAQLTRGYFYVATLEHLRRGGRISGAAALLGSALAIKPLLRLDEGHIEPLEKVRTASRAMARLQELVVQAAGTGPVDLAVHHLDAEQRALELADALSTAVPGASEVVVGEVGAVVGAHVGPGMVAAVVAPRLDGGDPAGTAA